VIFLRDNWDLRLDSSNLISLCKACHSSMHPEKLKKMKEKLGGNERKEGIPEEQWF
jgi:hypothetical protein